MRAADYALTMSEDELFACVRGLLDQLGYLWFHDNDARRNRSGLPDLIAIHPRTGFMVMVELKTEKGKHRLMQTKWMNALKLRQREAMYEGTWRPRHWQSGLIQAILRQGAHL